MYCSLSHHLPYVGYGVWVTDPMRSVRKGRWKGPAPAKIMQGQCYSLAEKSQLLFPKAPTSQIVQIVHLGASWIHNYRWIQTIYRYQQVPSTLTMPCLGCFVLFFISACTLVNPNWSTLWVRDWRIFTVGLESEEVIPLQESSGLCALSRALILLPPRDKFTLVYFFSPAESVGLLVPILLYGSSVQAS